MVNWVIMQDAATATGNGTPVTCTSHADGAWTDLVMQVVISDTATVTFEATVDGSTWHTLNVVDLEDGTDATTASASGIFRANVRGLTQVRARVSALTSGTVDVVGQLVATC